MKKTKNTIDLIQRDITGGKISKDIISTISDMPGNELKISGLRQDTFEYLIAKFGNRFEKIDFFKCPRVDDLSPLEDLGHIESIEWFWNIKATDLWDFSKNKKLHYLYFRDFQNVKSVEKMSASLSLTEVEISGGMWKKSQLESLGPLSAIDSLKSLAISTKVADGKAEPLTKMSKLEELYLPTNLFTTNQYAWLAAKIGNRVKCEELFPYRKVKFPERNRDGKLLDVIVVGKRKPILDSALDHDRLMKYVKKFNDLVQEYTDKPELIEPLP